MKTHTIMMRFEDYINIEKPILKYLSDRLKNNQTSDTESSSDDNNPVVEEFEREYIQPIQDNVQNEETLAVKYKEDQQQYNQQGLSKYLDEFKSERKQKGQNYGQHYRNKMSQTLTSSESEMVKNWENQKGRDKFLNNWKQRLNEIKPQTIDGNQQGKIGGYWDQIIQKEAVNKQLSKPNDYERQVLKKEFGIFEKQFKIIKLNYFNNEFNQQEKRKCQQVDKENNAKDVSQYGNWAQKLQAIKNETYSNKQNKYTNELKEKENSLDKNKEKQEILH